MLPADEEMSGALAAWHHVTTARTGPNGIFTAGDHDVVAVDCGHADDLVNREL